MLFICFTGNDWWKKNKHRYLQIQTELYFWTVLSAANQKTNISSTNDLFTATDTLSMTPKPALLELYNITTWGKKDIFSYTENMKKCNGCYTNVRLSSDTGILLRTGRQCCCLKNVLV